MRRSDWMRFLFVVASVTGCRTAGDYSSTAKDATGGTLQVQAGPMYKMTDSEIARVVSAMAQVKKDFYESIDGYDQTPSGTNNPPPIKEHTTCHGASPSKWSDLSTHYYCLYPGYAGGYFPNIRECFTYLVAPATANTIAGIKPTYPTAYDYCLYMPINRDGATTAGALKNTGRSNANHPAFDENMRKQSPPVGPFAWIHKNQADVYKFVMYTQNCTIDPASQQKVLNTFYKVDLMGKDTYTSADTNQVDECRAKRPRWGHDTSDGTHCSFDMRRKKPLDQNCYP